MNFLFRRASLLFLTVSLSSSAVAFSFSLENADAKNIPERLGWVSNKQYVCGGYYQDPLASLINTPLPPMDTTPVAIDADRPDIHVDGPSFLYGNVTLNQTGRYVRADQAEIDRDKATGKISTITLTGNVVLREPGKVMAGDSGQITLQNKFVHIMHAIYQMTIGRFVSSATTPEDSTQDLHAWGKVNEYYQQPSGIIQLFKASYTTCAPDTLSFWQLHAQRVDLDRDVGRGYAYNSWLTVKGVPVFYTPYFDFPIDNRRQTGFLFPTVGTSSVSGFNLSTPYYLNLAPNYDATITPHLFSARGLQLNGLFNYLTPSSSGMLDGSFLPHDRLFSNFQNLAPSRYTLISQQAQLNRLEDASDNRSAFTWQDKTNFSSRWSSTVNYNYVSDDYYYQDFNTPITTTPNQLPRLGSLNYAGDNWNFMGELAGYQTLHPINQNAINNAYSYLPELNWNGNFPNEAHGLNYQLNNQFVYFHRDRNPGETITPLSAGRLNIQPGISWPLTSLEGYVTPQVQFALTHYNVGNQVTGFPSEIQRSIPITDVDSGLYFDRDVSLGATDYQQTIEPRLFYLFVPYHGQNAIPIFDSGLIPFSYDSLFETNRFSGYDRIGDANQVTIAITTRLLNADSGAEKFRFSIGQIYYFRNRVVTTCAPNGTPGAASSALVCPNPDVMIGATPPKERTSPYAAQASYQLNYVWNTTANIAWDPHIHQTINGNWNFHYEPLPNHVVNATYSFIRFGDPITNPVTDSAINNLNQIGFSFGWPVLQHWSVIGSMNYNHSHGYPQTYFGGVQYDNCCWALRLVEGRTFQYLNQRNNPTFDNAVYLQWQLKGLGTVGTNNAAPLINSIPGYQDSFQSIPTFQRLTS